ncbi:8675_t:CDS:2 [Cetraspora pellucida]|uniref:8675_t:CDS:1 n=1 Tax=Cetraspora pellucida TaxID=1433469 RepID=A0A9N9DL87_9GLOM|nr:8675_t:CDS:2 [Cetraspora pellucida]
MQSEIDLLKQRISELEAKKAELEAKNAKLLKQVMEENARREAENVELKARIAKLKQTAEENTELKDRIMKLEQKQIQIIINEQEASHTKDILPYIKNHSYEEKGITPDPLPKIEYSSTQFESSMEPETFTTSLLQDIIDNDSVKTLEFLETMHKERISSEIKERNWKKKLQGSHNNSTQFKTSNTSTPESLDLKTPGQNISIIQEKETENIAQVIVNGIQDNNNLLDESKMRHSLEALPLQSFASSNHVIEISMMVLRQNSSTVLLLDLAQLFDKATDAEYSAIKANQEETLCWINYHLIIIHERRSKEMGLQLPEISRKTLCKKTQKAIRTYKIFDKIDESNIENHMTEISTSACHQNHTTEIVSTLPETKVSAFSKKLLLEKSSETISEKSSTSSNPTHDHAYFCNKTLLRYSDLYKAFITEKFDNYGIIEGLLCPVCKLNHDEKSVKSRYEDADDYILQDSLPETQISFEEKTLFVPQLNVQSRPSKPQLPISILSKDLEKKQQHIIKIVLK